MHFWAIDHLKKESPRDARLAFLAMPGLGKKKADPKSTFSIQFFLLLYQAAPFHPMDWPLLGFLQANHRGLSPI